MRAVRKTALGLVASVSAGFTIGWVDSSPGWDDTGVTAVSVLVVSGVIAVWQARRPWLWALAIGSWVPVLGYIRRDDASGIAALAIAAAGAAAGHLVATDRRA